MISLVPVLFLKDCVARVDKVQDEATMLQVLSGHCGLPATEFPSIGWNIQLKRSMAFGKHMCFDTAQNSSLD